MTESKETHAREQALHTSEGEVGGGKSVPQRVFEASVWQCWQEGGHDTEAL